MSKAELNKSLFDDKRTVVTSASSRRRSAVGGEVESSTDQLRIALDEIERLAITVIDRDGITVAEAVTMPANTPTGRAGRIAHGIQSVRRALVSPEATTAALTTYWMMQQFAAASLDEWRKEVRKGVASVESQRKAAEASKKRKGYIEVAKYLAGRYGTEHKPGSIWKRLRGDEAKPPPAWDMGKKVVRISVDGKQISCSGEEPITRAVFLKSYLKPAREAPAKG